MSDAVKTKRLKMRIGQKTSPNMAKKTNAQQWWILAGILLLGILLRVAYLRVLVKEPDFAFPGGDMVVHDYWARGLATGQWPKTQASIESLIHKIPFLRPPGYPYFLALMYWLFGTSYLVPRIVQMCLGLVSCVLAFFLGRSLFGRLYGLVFAALMSTYWGFIYFEGELSPPATLIVLVLALVGILMQWTRKFTYPNAIIAGVLLGLCALTSPSTLVLSPVVLVWGWWVAHRRDEQKRYVLRGLTLAVVTAVTVAPATIRNYVAADDFVLISCNDGLPLYCANNEVADIVNPNFPGMEKLIGRAAWGWFTYPLIVRGVEREQGRSMKYSEVSAYFTEKALAYMRQHPRRVLSLIATKVALFWGPIEVGRVIHYDRQSCAVLRYSPGFSVYLTLCILGVCLAFFDLRTARKGKGAAVSQVTRQIEICVLIFVLVVTYFASFLPFGASARYRVPIIPFVLLFAAYAIYRFGQSIRKRDWRIVAACGFIGAASYFYVSRPLPAYLPSRAQWHAIRAAAYYNSERLNLAIAEYREAIRLRPDFYLAHLNLANALLKQNKFSEMILPARQAVQLNPGSVDAHFILGVALTKTVHIDEGIEYFIKAAKLAPDYFDAHLNLGVAWAEKGKFDKAVECFEHARDLQPNNPIVHMMLAKSLEAQGRTERAISELREFLRLKPGDPEAQEILRNLTGRQKLEK